MGVTVKFSSAATVEEDQSHLADRAPRARALLIASICSLDNSLSSPCIVNNISAKGARITLSPSVPLSAEFRLCIPQRNLNCNARLAWRKGDQLGVQFQREPAATTTQNDSDERIKALEAENASLKAEIGVMRYQLYRREGG